MSNASYESDFYAWANEQAALLRAGNLSQADVEHIAEEIESMGRSEKHELINRLSVLLSHLLKWQFQPAFQGRSWLFTIKEQRIQIHDNLLENPSLRASFAESLSKAYKLALLLAEKETGVTSLPEICPYSQEQILDDEFFPGGES